MQLILVTQAELKYLNNGNETEMKQFYFSLNKTLNQSWNVVAVLANQSRYPLFMAWRANIGYRLWLTKTAQTFHSCFNRTNE